MLREMLVLVMTIVVLLLSTGGCKEASESPGVGEEQVKTAAEYEAEAEEEINEENMNQELDKLEQELGQEATQIQ